jgi:DNA-binding HxlR family transcriptional regulator
LIKGDSHAEEFAMYDYNEACPISMAASVLCERWTLQIVREMFFGSTRYSEIQRYLPNISPSLLRDRLRSLEKQGIIVRKRSARSAHHEYFLTSAGKALSPLLTEMGRWGMRFARNGMTDKQNTAWGLVRDFAGGLDVEALPAAEASILFNLTDVHEAPRHYIHFRSGKIQVCDTDLGFEVDVHITSTLDVMTRIWYGEIALDQAVRDERMKVNSMAAFRRHIGRWLRISSFTTDNPAIGADSLPEPD